MNLMQKVGISKANKLGVYDLLKRFGMDYDKG